MPELEPMLFIGGTMDGKRMCIPKDVQTYIFPFSPEKLVLRTFRSYEKVVTSPNTPYIYYRATFYAGNGIKVQFMVHSSIKVEEAMEKLLEFYNPPTASIELKDIK